MLRDWQPLEFAVVGCTAIEKTWDHLPLLRLDELDVQLARKVELRNDESQNLNFFSVPVFLLSELECFVPTNRSARYCSSTILYSPTHSLKFSGLSSFCRYSRKAVSFFSRREPEPGADSTSLWKARVNSPSLFSSTFGIKSFAEINYGEFMESQIFIRNKWNEPLRKAFRM